MPERLLPLAESVKSDDVRWRFLKAKTVEDPRPSVQPLLRQASHMISTLVATDRLIVLPPGVGEIAAGTLVKTWALPRIGGECR